MDVLLSAVVVHWCILVLVDSMFIGLYVSWEVGQWRWDRVCEGPSFDIQLNHPCLWYLWEVLVPHPYLHHLLLTMRPVQTIVRIPIGIASAGIRVVE